MKKAFLMLVVPAILTFYGCGTDDGVAGEEEQEEVSGQILDETLFKTYSRVGDFTVVDCQLSEGSSGQCLQVKYTLTASIITMFQRPRHLIIWIVLKVWLLQIMVF